MNIFILSITVYNAPFLFYIPTTILSGKANREGASDVVQSAIATAAHCAAHRAAGHAANQSTMTPTLSSEPRRSASSARYLAIFSFLR